VAAVAEELAAFTGVLASALTTAAIGAVLYMAVEPYVRRRMPELMIGWARLLEGRLRDPRVGRDVMLGALFGSLGAVLVHVSNALPTWVPILGQTPVPPDMRMLEGVPRTLAALIDRTQFSLTVALSVFFGLFLLRMALRTERRAMVATMILLSLVNLGGENVALETPFAIAQGILMGWTIGRFGLLAGVVMWFFRIALSGIPLPIAATTPYTAATLLVIAVLLVTVGYALRISIGSRPLFSGAALDE
jgi:hypothetical protein